MKFRFLAAAFAVAALAAQHASALSPDPYAAAVSDPGRPAADTARDVARKPAETLAFAKVHPGETVIEIAPGAGYFTRLLSKAVGPEGHVYALTPPQMAKPVAAIAADPAYANVTVVSFMDRDAVTAIPKVDLIFTAQNYHDLHLTLAHLDVPAVDTSWFEKLKPKGHLVIIDHVAAAGAPVVETADALHRIDPAFVRKEVEGAGFVFDGETEFLRNPADPHTRIVFDPTIRGHTDQFAFRFIKP
jgi:predicted methyltransferase